MAGGKVYGSSNTTVLLQNKRLPCSPDVFYSVWVPSSDPSLQGSTSSMVNFDVGNARDIITDERHFLRSLDKEEDGGGDDCDMFFHQAGKKRRLTTDQVRFLEKSFEVENKLEPERKIQLANDLGLLPRQVAIWFQNRRARFKTKQLEKDYCSLKACHEKLKFDYDNLLKENDNLKNEVNSLKSRLLDEEENGKKNDKGSVDDTVDESDKETVKAISSVACENGMGTVVTMACKQEDVNSVKSDVFDSDSPHYRDCNHSRFLEPADSSHALGPDHSDFSQDEEDDRSKSLLPFQFLPKAEDACYDDPTDNSCHFSFPIEDHETFCFWP